MMNKKRITKLNTLTSAANDDLLVIVDIVDTNGVNVTKNITNRNLFQYDNSQTQLSANNIRDAIVEIDSKIEDINTEFNNHIDDEDIHYVQEDINISATQVMFDNVGTDLSATNVQDVINEIDKKIDDLDTSSWESDGIDHIKPKDNKLVKVEHIDGVVDTSAFNNHIDDEDIHYVQSAIDHTSIQNIGTYTHEDIDNHIDDEDIHYVQSAIDHTSIQNIGTYTHEDIDNHIDDEDIHYVQEDINISATQVMFDNVGTDLSATNVQDVINEIDKKIDDLDTSSWESDGIDHIKPKDNKLVKVEHIEGVLTEELDPTVPEHVKSITSADIEEWNSKLDSETDPTVPEHVKSITESDLENWDTAYDLRHSHDNKDVLDTITQNLLDSFLTEETDPTVPAHVKGITEINIANWYEAYEWGDHADVGYLTGSISENYLAMGGSNGLVDSPMYFDPDLDLLETLSGIRSKKISVGGAIPGQPLAVLDSVDNVIGRLTLYSGTVPMTLQPVANGFLLTGGGVYSSPNQFAGKLRLQSSAGSDARFDIDTPNGPQSKAHIHNPVLNEPCFLQISNVYTGGSQPTQGLLLGVDNQGRSVIRSGGYGRGLRIELADGLGGYNVVVEHAYYTLTELLGTRFNGHVGLGVDPNPDMRLAIGGNLGVAGSVAASAGFFGSLLVDDGSLRPVWHEGNLDPAMFMTLGGPIQFIPDNPDLNTFGNNEFVAALTGSSAPHRPGNYYTVINFPGSMRAGGNQRNFQLASFYSGTNTNRFQMRSRNDVTGDWADWVELWHSGNFNPDDYLPLTGGAVTGNFIIASSGLFRLNNDQRQEFISGETRSYIYTTSNVQQEFPFDGSGHTVFQGRSNADNRSMVFVTGNPPAVRMDVNESRVRFRQDVQVDGSVDIYGPVHCRGKLTLSDRDLSNGAPLNIPNVGTSNPP
ncbi:MAG: hypothetical protein WC260_01820, partial [Candidatus Pacearchaeota archaeon]